MAQMNSSTSQSNSTDTVSTAGVTSPTSTTFTAAAQQNYLQLLQQMAQLQQLQQCEYTVWGCTIVINSRNWIIIDLQIRSCMYIVLHRMLIVLCSAMLCSIVNALHALQLPLGTPHLPVLLARPSPHQEMLSVLAQWLPPHWHNHSWQTSSCGHHPLLYMALWIAHKHLSEVSFIYRTDFLMGTKCGYSGTCRY